MLKQTSRQKRNTKGPLGGKAPQRGKMKQSIRKFKIKNKDAYDVVMKEIDVLMKKGEQNLSDRELARLRKLAEAAEFFEDQNDPLPLPPSLPEIIKMKMFQLKLNQQFTAQLLDISEAKFSLIMNGKQKPDVYFLKAVHEKLNVDASAILESL